MSDNCNCHPEKSTIKLPIQSIGFPCQGMSIDIDASAIDQCRCTLASPVQQGQVPEGGLVKQVYQVSEDGKRYEFRELPLATETEPGLALRVATNSEVELGEGKGLVSADQLVFLLTKLEELEEQDRKLEEQDCQLQDKDQQLEERAQQLEFFTRQLFYPGAFRNFYEQTPFPCWAVRDGSVLEDAEESYPELWEALQKPENAWKVKTLAQWTALSTSAGGVGGVPFFVLDQGAKTIKLPDTRGDYEEGAGFDELIVGGWHTDAQRSLTGQFAARGWNNNTTQALISGAHAGVFCAGSLPQSIVIPAYSTTSTGSTSKYPIYTDFDNSLQTPVANKNQPRAFGVLPCVYIGGI